MKYYKVPALSRVAGWVARMLPNRVHAWIWINAYRELDQHYRHDVNDHRPDGTREFYSAVSEIRVENLMREIWRHHLKATTHENP